MVSSFGVLVRCCLYGVLIGVLVWCSNWCFCFMVFCIWCFFVCCSSMVA